MFPTVYRMNTRRALRRLFPPEQWEDYTYTYTPEPAYLPNSRLVWWSVLAFEKFLPRAFGTNLFVFMRKRSVAENNP